MRILIVEDDRLVVRSLKLVLDGTGIEHEAVNTGEAGIELATHHDYDVILLDLSLPDCHGYEVLRSLRKANVATPVMILTGISEVATKVTGFGFGADDYITKPFLGPELVARLHALVRRSQGRAQRVVTVGPMVVDLEARTVSVADRRVPLTGKEYAILELLALRRGVTLTKEMFLTHLYGGRDEPELKIIDVFICKMRKKLADVAPDAARCIETVWGRGYTLRDPEVRQIVQVA